MRRGIAGDWPVRTEVIEQSSVANERPVIVEAPSGPPPPGPPVEPPPDRELWPWLLVLLVLVLGGLAAVWVATRDEGSRSPQRSVVVQATSPQPEAKKAAQPRAASTRVTVPRLVGLAAPAALKRLQELGLTALTHNVFSTKPRTQVVAQTPGPTTKLLRRGSVTLEVSKGPKPAPVGDVVGQAVADATALLGTQGFKSRIVRVPSSEPAGEVVAQHPKAGAMAPPTTVVRLNVSAGNAANPSPAATTSNTAPPVSKRPSPTSKNASAPPSSPSASTGPNQSSSSQSNPPSTTQPSSADGASISVPDVTGEDESTATDDLQSAGLTVRVVDRDTPDPSEDGTVVEQTPTANASIQPDATVTIYVGRYTQQQ
jgi:serine/threonine-protein kinase